MAIDPYTKREFTPKRSNQIFEFKENRIAFNNAKAREFRHRTQVAYTPIIQNIKIIEKLMQERPNKYIHREYLLGMGFSFYHFTSFEKVGNEYLYRIFDYVIVQKDKDFFYFKTVG